MMIDKTTSQMGVIIQHQNTNDIMLQLMEEMGELQQALGKFYRAGGCGLPLGSALTINDAKTNIAEEMADVRVCLDELVLKLNLNQAYIDDVYKMKVARSLGRIYEN